MKKSKILSILIAGGISAFCGALNAFAGDHTKYVDPFIGSIGTGHTFPGACVPFGMIQASPVTGSVGWNYCSEYIGTDTVIWGFTQNHLNGTGCMDLGDILVMPINGATSCQLQHQVGYPTPPTPPDNVAAEVARAEAGMVNAASPFLKTNESARPGYYSVFLDRPQVKAEVSAMPHVAFYRFTPEDKGRENCGKGGMKCDKDGMKCDKGGMKCDKDGMKCDKDGMKCDKGGRNCDKGRFSGIFVDLSHGPAWRVQQYHEQVSCCEVQIDDAYTISGHVRNRVWVEQDYWFVIRFSKPMQAQHWLKSGKGEKGKRFILDFDLANGEVLEMQVAMSSYSLDGARRNLQAEAPAAPQDGPDLFTLTTEKADKEWEKYLSLIEVTGTEDQKKNFYTGFYHALIQPNNIADVDGRYRDTKGNPAQCEVGNEYFSTFSCWDTYRAAHPFYTLMIPDKVNAMVRSMVSFAESEGHLPIWGLWGRDNYCMIGNHAISIIAEAYHKGLRGFDAERAFQAIKRTQTENHPDKSQWDIYTKYGYYPTDLVAAESVSQTLEISYDDYAAADMARLLGKTEDEAYFAERAQWYKNLFDPETKFMRPRLSDGTWKTPFDPSGLAHAESVGGDYTEGNAWQYTWHVLQDPEALMQLMGGKKAFIERLDKFFTTKLESTLSDVSGLIGQYAHGNEPSHHVAYLYALAGQPRRTQELVREIFDTQYLPKADGLCGNDDCGQMSAWYMLSAMGFYPVSPVSGKYIFGAPQMEKFVLHLDGGKTFTIEAKGLSAQNKYVKKILLNGKPYKQNYIDHAAIVSGGTLTYVMGK